MPSESRALKPVVEEVPQPVVLENVPTATYVRAETFVAKYQLLEKIAQGMLGGSLTPKGVNKVSDVVMILMLGEELGIDYMQALRNIYVVNGRPVLGSDLMAGAVMSYCERRGGGYIRVIDTSAEACTVEFMRHDESEPRTITWTRDDAQRAGLLGKDNWKNYPADMMRARALSRAARIGWPDLLGGVYDPDELTTVAHPETRPARSSSSVSVAESDPAAIEATSAPAPLPDTAQIAPDALDKIREKAAERGVEGVAFDHLTWYRFDGLASPADMTRGQGVELYRFFRDAPDHEIGLEMSATSQAVDAYVTKMNADEEQHRAEQVVSK